MDYDIIHLFWVQVLIGACLVFALGFIGGNK